MRRLSSFLALGGLAFASFLATHRATAQSFPNPPASTTPFWIPMTRGGAPVTDPANATADARDIVGDATHPAAFIASDAGFLYLRVRVNGNPGAAEDRGFGCLINTDATLTTYELIAAYDGNGTDTIRYFPNTATTTSNSSAENADATGTTNPATTHGKITATGDAIFSSNADYFVDLAVPWATVRTGSVTSATQLRFVCGTTTDATVANDLAADIFDGGTAVTLSTNWSDAYTCNNAGNPRCVTATDSDGDGVQNTAETGFGTNPNNFDSDGDGIPDYYELLSGSDLVFSAVNSDTDPTIDALDTDSDNDCTPDSTDGLANYRNATLPNAQPNTACSGTTPICNRSVGTCVACNGDQGSGSTLPCYDVAKPYCDVSGRCAECTAAKTFACNTPAKPACDTSIGACAACNGDKGSAATAVCTNSLAPACNAGKCTQCSQTNTSLCTNVSPACSTATGTCVECTGDNGDAASTAPCPTTTTPACNASGPLKGRCTTCSASNVAKCPTDKPSCDTNGGACVPCDGDHNGGTFFGCPSDAAPTCALSGANKGQCAKCTTSADCGTGHTGPTCDKTTGACIDVDTDGDGIQDEVEDLLGTDKTKKDTDGDGVDDKTEVTPQGGGSFAKVDTDGDGTIDALDTDSDGDGIADKDEGNQGDAGTLLDTDGDKIPNFRDRDDDGDGIDTVDEIKDATDAKVSDDVDGDGLKNWLDDDANGNKVLDGNDGRGDEDNDGIPNYLDLIEDLPDAGPSSSSSSSSGSSSSSSSSSSSGFTKTPVGSGNDAGSTGPTAAAPDDAVLEGSGCSTTSGSLSSVFAFLLGVVGLGLVARRRRGRS